MIQLKLSITDSGEGPIFDRFFEGYDRAFVLPDEKEDREGLVEALALNSNAEGERLRSLYGPFRETCLIAEEPDGRPVGGANFIAMPAPGAPGIVTANLNYIYVDPQARGRGNLRRLVAATWDVIANAFADTHGPLRPLVFLEQNDPIRMSAEAYARDTEFTGLDQLDRLRIWRKLGTMLVDFDYIQPPLSPDQEPDDTLLYSILGASEPSVSPALVRDHLAGFFGISVLKGAPLKSDPTAACILAWLDETQAAGDHIALLDPSTLLDKADRRETLMEMGVGAGSLRDVVRTIGR